MTEIGDWRVRRDRYRLLASRCRSCGVKYFPRRYNCLKCGSGDMDVIELPKRGRVVSYTIIHFAPKRFAKYAPYAVAYIELDDGTKILGQLTDIDLNEIHIGMEVEATLRRLYEYGEDGPIIYGLKFRPVVS
jgi:hypothetical protein